MWTVECVCEKGREEGGKIGGGGGGGGEKGGKTEVHQTCKLVKY